MQTLFKPNLFSSSSSKVGAKNFVSGGKKLGSSIVGAAKNNIIGFNRTAQAMMPEKKEEKESSFIKNYTNFFGSKKTEKILRKNLKLVRDSLVNTFEIARHLKAAIISISGGLKGGAGKGGGGIFGAIKTFLTGALGGLLIAALPFLLKLAAIGSLVGIGIALWKSEKFRELTMDFIKFAADKIWKILKPLATATIKALMDVPSKVLPSFFPEEGGINWQKKTPNQLVNESVQEDGPEKTLELLRKEYNEKKEAGKFDSIDGKLTGLESEMLNQMGRVEAMVARKEKKIVLEKIWQREKKVRVDELRKERNASPELKAIIDSKDKKAYDEYRAETKRLMDELGNEIDEKYKQILIQGSTGGTIHESITGIGDKWKGSSFVNNPASSSSVSSDSNSEVNAVRSDLNSMNFENFYDDGSLNKPTFNFAPITFDNAQQQDSSGGEVASTSGGNTSNGNAIAFHSSSNSDPSYHKLNALVTFNIV